MKKPKIKTRVVHSDSKPAWNIVGIQLGGKYKIARVPYVPSEHVDVMEREKEEARQHAEFISYCFNNSEGINTMTKQEAKDKAAQERGYKDWVHAMYLMNENGISELTDKALDIYLNENIKTEPAVPAFIEDGK